MLVGGGMIDDVRLVLFKHLINATAVTDRTDQHNQIDLGMFSPQFLFNFIGIVFIDIKNNQFLRMMQCNLPAEFRTNASAPAGHQNRLSVDEPINLCQITADGIPAQQLLNGYILHCRDGDVPVHQLEHARKVFQFTFGFLTDLQDFTAFRFRCAGNRHINFADIVFFDHCRYFVPASDNRNTVDVPVPFVRIIVNNAADFSVDLLCLMEIPQNHLTGISGTHQKNPRRRLDHCFFPRRLFHQIEPIGKPRSQHEQVLKKRPHYIIGNRHPVIEQPYHGKMERRGNTVCNGYPCQLVIACKTPEALIQPEGAEKNNTENGIDG